MRFGILGYGKIARQAVAPAIEAAGHTVSVIGSARGAKPDGFQGLVLTDYADVLDREQIDALYVGLPNHLHHHYSKAALSLGIPVLCEKPLGLTASEVTDLEATAFEHHTYLQEAFMVAHHPQWHWIRDRVREGSRCELSVSFHYDNRDPQNIRNRAETGGGARLDIGCYGLWAADWLGARTLTEAIGVQHMEDNIDAATTAEMQFAECCQLLMDVSMRRARFQQVVVQSDIGCWVLPRAFNPSETAEIWIMDANGIAEVIQFHGNQYQHMIEDFCQAIDQDRPADLSASRRIAQWSDQLQHQLTKRPQP